MKNMTTTILVAAASTLLLGNAVLAESCGSKHAATASHGHDIVDTAVAAGSFNTLVTAVKAAGLVDTLKGAGPFTVFAPTDEAFAKLPTGALEALLANPEQLKSVLLYHVVPGKVMAADVMKLTSASTALGQAISVDTTDGVRINNAKVLKADVGASNGVIHVIDTVIMPKKDIVDVAKSAGSFGTLLTALDAAGLSDTLRGEGPFTVFAPTDEAFAKLPKGTLTALLADKEKLRSILLYHVVPANVMAADVVKLAEAETAQGGKLRIDSSSGVKINDARVIKTDVAAGNGVIHVIDTVLLPS